MFRTICTPAVIIRNRHQIRITLRMIQVGTQCCWRIKTIYLIRPQTNTERQNIKIKFHNKSKKAHLLHCVRMSCFREQKINNKLFRLTLQYS